MISPSAHDNMWREMLARSFDPREWFEGRDWPEQCEAEGSRMWVYRKTESHVWTVGFYAPDGSWNPESDHDTAEAAAGRVRFLNGGGTAETVSVSGTSSEAVTQAARRGFSGTE